MVMVAELIDAGMSVVDFEMSFEHGVGQVMRGDCVVIIRMIEMRENLASGPFRLIVHRAEVVRDGFGDRRSAERRDRFFKVGGVDVNRHAFGLVADFLGRNHEKLAALFDQRAELFQRLEPHFRIGSFAAALDPSVAEARDVFRNNVGAGFLRQLAFLLPANALAQHVMVGEREEVVVVCAVPIGDHVGEVVTVAPEGVRVQIAFPPARRGSGRKRRRRPPESASRRT
jgi:hypothetical protein